MNLLNKKTAKFYVSVIVLIVMTFLTNNIHAQTEYTTISKNINPDASALYHDLSPQGDSLYLKYESIFYKVTFLNSLDKKVYKYNPPVKEAKISLHDIIVGDYTVLVYGRDRIIVFHISRLLEIDKPENLVAIKELPLAALPVNSTNPESNSLENMAMNQINTDNILDFENVEMKLAINDDNVSVGEPNFTNTIKAYNLTEMNRAGMQTRDDYRRNNLRPNGKPYF